MTASLARMNDGLPALRAVVALLDHPVFRDGLGMILRERGIEVVAEVADGQGAPDAGLLLIIPTSC